MIRGWLRRLYGIRIMYPYYVSSAENTAGERYGLRIYFLYDVYVVTHNTQ